MCNNEFRSDLRNKKFSEPEYYYNIELVNDGRKEVFVLSILSEEDLEAEYEYFYLADAEADLKEAAKYYDVEFIKS